MKGAIKKTLKDFGLTERETQVYIFLGKRAPLKGGDVARQLKMNKGQVYRTLKNLQAKGLVELTLEQPTRFSAIPFKKVIDSFIKAKRKEVALIEKSKEALLSDWEKISKTKPLPQVPKFTVVEGNKKIYSKISEMVKKTKTKLAIISTGQGLINADKLGILDEVVNHPLKNQIKFRFITQISKQNLKAIKRIYDEVKVDLKLKGRTPELGSKPYPRMVIRDDEEILFFITPKPTSTDEACFCTNCESIIQAFNGVFEDLWKNSLEIEQKFVELETGKPAPEMKLIKDKKKARKLYFNALNTAKKEILIVTSSERLIGLAQNISNLNKWCKNGVSIKILAPITGENIGIAANLLECCEIRHIPYGYNEMTIIDNQNMFHFTNPTTKANASILNLENVLFTNDSNYVKQTKSMINNVWKNIHKLSNVTSKPYIQSTETTQKKPQLQYVSKIEGITHLKDEKPFGGLKEKDVLNKIIKAQKASCRPSSKKKVTQYGTYGRAIIHPPKILRLPEIEFNFYHFDKHSTLGAEDSMIIGILRDIPNTQSYIPAAFVGDNPKALEFVKILFKKIIPENSYQLVQKDQLQIRIHGNNLFCAWSIPIKLLDKYLLPPGSILLEGYGKIKTRSFSRAYPSGYRMDQARNYLESFVTFFHPESKYSGPGTDSIIARDIIMEFYKQ